ncbi:hypothetical protein HQ487_03545 [Candidatus Uhrbacteria bacterium]|nr:hypothetical protein [Candidatus Uhrbacteria bacterium]
MQRLNIPFSRHTTTTRRNRRVVWLLIGLLGVFLVLLSRIGILWFSRGEILSLAPSNTVLAIQVQITQTTEPFLSNWLSGVPLISNRSIEFSDILPMTKGELALFVTSSGGRSIAIRANKSAINTELLETYSISIQESGSFLLLSETLLPISGTDPLVHRSFFPSVGKRWFGRVVLPEEGIGGNIFSSTDKLSIEFNTEKKQIKEQQVIPNLGLSIGDLMWGEEIPLTPLTHLIEPFVQDGVDKPFFLNTNSLLKVFIQETETGRRTLIVQKEANPDSTTIIRDLQLIGAFSKPTISATTLSDGTLYQEIEVHPDLVSVEEISTNLGLSYRVSTENGSAVFASVYEKDLLISDSQELLESYGKDAVTVDESSVCLANSDYLNPSFILSETSSNYYNPQHSFFYELFDQISGISLEFNKYSTIVTLCKN